MLNVECFRRLLRLSSATSREAVQALEFLLQPIEFFITEVFEIDQAGSRAFDATEQFIELQMQRLGVAVLRVLDQEYHQERNDRGRGIDNQLPRVGIMEHRAEHRPRDNRHESQAESPGRSDRDRQPVGTAPKPSTRVAAVCFADAVLGLNRGVLRIHEGTYPSAAKGK